MVLHLLFDEYTGVFVWIKGFWEDFWIGFMDLALFLADLVCFLTRLTIRTPYSFISYYIVR